MSHTIYVGKIAKRRNSTLQPTLSTSFDVLLKSPTSLHTPTFTINATSFDYNYLKWDDRYYFVTDVTSRNNNIWDVSAVCDVLATFKTDIIGSTQFVSYSSHKTSDWLADTRIPVLRNCKVASNTSLTGVLSTIGCYVLSVVGKNSCSTFMIQNEGILKAILANIQTWQDNGINAADALIDTWRGIDLNGIEYYAPSDDFTGLADAIVKTCVACFNALTGTLGNIQKALADSIVTIGRAIVDTGFVGNSYLNAPDCIRSCIWVPFDYAMAPTSGSASIYLGTYDSGQSGYVLKSTPVTGSNTVSIPWHYSDWRRGYCEDVYLYLPFVGMVALSADSITNASSITIDWSVTYTDGTIMYKVITGGEVIGAYGGQCSVNYPIGLAQQASAGEIVQTLFGAQQKTVNALTQTSISPVSSMAGAVEAGMSVLTGMYETANVALSTHVSSVGGIGGGAGVGLGRDCVCYTVAHDLAVTPSDMKNTMGVPTMQPMSLSTLTGYCQCANAHVAATGAESQELDEIDAYLNAGFYIE